MTTHYQKGGFSMLIADNVALALWKVEGIKRMCSGLQSSDNYDEEDQNVFFVISEELEQVKELLKEITISS